MHRLGELNVIEQAVHVCRTTIVQDAWRRGQPLTVHGWIYGVADGLLRDLGISVTALDELPSIYERAMGEGRTPAGAPWTATPAPLRRAPADADVVPDSRGRPRSPGSRPDGLARALSLLPHELAGARSPNRRSR